MRRSAAVSGVPIMTRGGMLQNRDDRLDRARLAFSPRGVKGAAAFCHGRAGG
jgi:hypothetical protein